MWGERQLPGGMCRVALGGMGPRIPRIPIPQGSEIPNHPPGSPRTLKYPEQSHRILKDQRTNHRQVP